MLPLIRKVLFAFFLDELAFRRWLRGGLAAAVAILVQVMADQGWQTWTVKQWALRLIPSALAFAHGAIQSSAKAAPSP